MSETERAIERAMIIVAHPDDAEFGAGGTVAGWTAAGVEVVYVIVTDGSKGSNDRSMTSQSLSELRMREQHDAAEILGVHEVVFIGVPDGEVVPDLALRHALTREIRVHRPDVVITHDPATFYLDTYINHPDHRAVGQAALEAVFPTARDFLNAAHLLEEGHEPHKVGQVWLTITRQPDHAVEISETMDLKIDALRAHASQFEEFDKVAQWVRERGALMAKSREGMALAEVFKRITLS
jgi:LmbE family N-acetylglucosaminyl deacetylase